MIIPNEQYKPTTPDTISTPQNRSPQLYLQVVKQFPVETHVRWAPIPAKGITWCNILLWDWSRAMSAEIPHWVDQQGNPTAMGVGTETTANGVCDWLMNCGAKFGWTPSDLSGAVANSKKGKPTVVVWKNPKGHGHVAVVLPTDPAPRISQAGASNFQDKPLATSFGNLPVTYYIHL